MDMKILNNRPAAHGYTKRWGPTAIICLVVVLGLGKLLVPYNGNTTESLNPSNTESPSVLASTATSDAEAKHIEHNEKRQSQKFVVTGINWNGLQQRRNFLDFAADADLLNIFLCGLEAMQNMDQNDRESYFQIAGIHGAPYVPWDGEDGPNSFSGYCTHASILFPTWHRPYIAAYEQILGNIIRNLANQYPASSRSRYQAAANRFRLPYWDWASNANIPNIIGTQVQVTVEKPQGFVRIDNPLYTYTFHPFSPDFFPYAPFDDWPLTLRQPDFEGDSHPETANSQLSANQVSLRNRVYNLLSFQNNYQVFSNKAWDNGGSGNQDSIESIHDLVHGAVGGGGLLKRSLEKRTGEPQLMQGNKYHEWAANIRLDKYSAGGPYLINLYVGEPKSVHNWTNDPNFVGSYYLFSKNGTCMGCKPNSIVTGSVPLTEALMRRVDNGDIESLEPANVTPYLKGRITWRVRQTDGKFLSPSDVKTLKVSVSAAEVTIPWSLATAPEITRWTTYYDITNKKPGGLCYGDPV
ncbi:hypothetical protein DRE_03971 [Drechslerella stenobrocha 248]|uniref:tyrosinase n=1 Tax=Drechslerella stenobrocha 248 TaxID=1043628 RepID=W7HRQ1_9PEZI|nr:hypothetical protein DRE_03971 [Drechslerella stenobrocha 248]